MRESKMCRSVSRHLWSWRSMQGHTSQPNLCMREWLHGRSVHLLLCNAKYVYTEYLECTISCFQYLVLKFKDNENELILPIWTLIVSIFPRIFERKNTTIYSLYFSIVSKPEDTQYPKDPCLPSPCGPNSLCRAIGDAPACSCMQNYIGAPPNCRPECSINSDCPADKACIREKCRDPCPGSCGFLARCSVINHTPSCVCPEGYTGDPFVGCNTVPQRPRKNSVFRDIIVRKLVKQFKSRQYSIYIHISVPPPDRCNPSPCGQNARCNDGICTCISEYFGDPYVGCRPECVINADCSRDKACMLHKCRDPCLGTCGFNAECNVINHLPMCSCPRNMTGNAFISCTALQGLYASTVTFYNRFVVAI